MKIVIDAYGGDNAPQCNIEGAVTAINKNTELTVVLSGKEAELQALLKDYKYDATRLQVISAEDVISNDDAPVEAIRKKGNSSLVVAYEYLKNNDDCIGIISAGSTGAVLSGALLKLGRIKGVSRPALAPLLPTKTGGQVLLIDCGANVDCKTENLYQFAIMGSIYYKKLFNVENPRVALLSVGTEDHKGNAFSKEVFAGLKKLPINFIGNMEARYLLSGDYDVVVTDGFNGNVLLKATEGAFAVAMDELKSIINGSFKAKIGALFMKKPLMEMKSKFDYNKYGGSPFLGTKKTVIKSHGSSKGNTIASAIEQVVAIEEGKINSLINEEFTKLGEQDVL